MRSAPITSFDELRCDTSLEARAHITPHTYTHHPVSWWILTGCKRGGRVSFDALTASGASLSPVHLLPESVASRRSDLVFLSVCKQQPTYWVGGMRDGRAAVWKGRKRLLVLSCAQQANDDSALDAPLITDEPLPPVLAACFSPRSNAVIFLPHFDAKHY